jgi:hypothetical protein
MKWARQIKCYVVLSITSVFSHYLNDIYKFASMNNVADIKKNKYIRTLTGTKNDSL